jgi:uncharacterized membrane protein YccC
VVNGYTGVIAGQYPKSWIKISLAVFLAILIIVIVVLMVSSNSQR